MDARKYWLTVASVGLLTAAGPSTERSRTWFADHTQQRLRVLEICKEYPGSAHREPNCENAVAGDILAAKRAAERPQGVANLGAPSAAYWRNPANHDDAMFWARQCRIAEANGKTTYEQLRSMYCPQIHDAGL